MSTARQTGQPTPNKPSKDDIKSWLKQHGAPFEMRVARHLDDLGFSVMQSHYWRDVESGKSLEIDIRTRHVLVTKPFGSLADAFGDRTISVEYVIECKTISKHPWVVFHKDDEREYDEWMRVHGLISTDQSSDYLSRVFSAPIDPKPRHVAMPSGINGYGIAVYDPDKKEAKANDGVDLAYSTLKKVTKAARFFSAPEQDWHKPIARLMVPVVVVSGGLYSASLRSSGRLSIKPIKQAHLYWNGNVDTSANSRVQILTESAVVPYFSAQKRDLDRLSQFLEPHAEAVCAKIQLPFRLTMSSSFWDQVDDPQSDLHAQLRQLQLERDAAEADMLRQPAPGTKDR